ncbi:MAG TPA: hypothetical protein VF719_11820 [Abditibacteriaceae bacterium]|jgi:cytochrome bd-type quinol oxidase subunit 2
MPRKKRVLTFILSATGVFVCAFVLFGVMVQTQGVNIYDDIKYQKSKAPFSYTVSDWFQEMLVFFVNFAAPLIMGTAAVVFGLYWWMNRCEVETRDRAVKHATRAAFASSACMLVVFFLTEIMIWVSGTETIARLNQSGPPT